MGIFDQVLPTISNGAKSAWNFLEGGAQNVAEDIGTTLGYNDPNYQKSQQDAIAMAQKAAQKAQQTSDPAEKARLYKIAAATHATVSNNLTKQAQSYSPDVNQNPIQRGLTAGTQIATGADIFAHPIGTLKAPFQLAKGIVKGAGALATATGEDVSNAIKAAPGAIKTFIKDDANKSFKLPDKQLPTIPSTGKTAKPSSTTDLGNRFLKGQYNASPATERAFTMDHLNQLANYGLTTPRQVADAAETFTGQDGIVPKIIRKVISQAAPVDTTGMADVAQNIVSHQEGLRPTDEAKFLQNTAKDLETKVSNAPSAGDVTTKDPLDFYDHMRSIKRKAATFLAGKSDESKALGQAYQQFANEMEDRLYMTSGANKILNQTTLSPEDEAALSKISPKLTSDVKDILANGTVGDLRHIQQPFVTGSQAAAETVDRIKGNPISMRQILELYIGLHGNPAGLALAAADTNVGKNIAGNLLRGFQSGGEKVAAGSAAMLPKIAGQSAAASSLPLAAPALAKVSNPPEDQNQASQYNGDQTHSSIIPSPVTDVKQLPQSIDDAKKLQNQDGSYSMPNIYTIKGLDGTSLAISPEDAAYQKELINNKYNSNKVYYDNNINAKAAEIDGPLQNIKTKEDYTSSIIKPYNDTKNLVEHIEDGKKLLGQVDPSLLSLNTTWDELSKKLSGKYGQLSQAMSEVEALYPAIGKTLVTNQPGSTLSDLLDRAERATLYNFSSVIGTTTGGTDSDQQAQSQVPVNPPQPSSAPKGVTLGNSSGAFQLNGSGLNAPLPSIQ